MVPRARPFLLALAVAVGGADAFKFLSNFKAPEIISKGQKVKLALTEERFGEKKLVVITGCASDVGRETVRNLLDTGEYHVIGTVRDAEERGAVAAMDGFDGDRVRLMDCALDSFESVHSFCEELQEYQLAKPIDRLICSAEAYPSSPGAPQWSADGHERVMQVNFLSHFLLISRLLDGMKEAPDPRVLVAGSVAAGGGDDGGADLMRLDGFRAGFARPVAMADGYGFSGAKAHADARLALATASRVLNAKFFKSHGVAFSAVDVGRRSPFSEEGAGVRAALPPLLRRADLGGVVGAGEAGRRLCQAATDPKCGRGGVCWSWGEGDAPESGGEDEAAAHALDQADAVHDPELGVALFQTATRITGAGWPNAKSFVSPCPTLHVVGAVSANMMAREELKRMAERPGFNEDGTSVKLSKRKRAALIADKVIVQGVLGNTVGRVGKLAGRLLLGKIPETAKTGSFQEEKPLEEEQVLDDGNRLLIEDLEDKEMFEQVFAVGKDADGKVSKEREWKVGEPEKEKELAKV